MKITARKLLFESYDSRDLLIINIQPSMSGRLKFKIEDFGAWLNNVGDEFDNIHFFYNGENKQDNPVTITKWYENEGGINDGIISQSQNIQALASYFDGLLDSNYTDDEIVLVGKYLLSRNYDKVSNMTPDELQQLTISSQFKEDLSKNKYKFAIPHELYRDLNEMSRPIVVGGLGHDCMRMIELSFKIINKNYEKLEDWVF